MISCAAPAMWTEMAPHTIRPARASDVERLLPLVKAYYAFDRIAYDAETLRGALTQLLKDNSLGRVWIIDTGRSLAGYAVLAYSYDLEFGGREAIITDLFVSARHRRQGLGARLLSTIIAFCRREALYEIELHVTRENRGAMAFYKSFGFVDRRRTVLTLEVKQA
jgi:ribosomal protein S18 acetylase RimI-like enzyme